MPRISRPGALATALLLTVSVPAGAICTVGAPAFGGSAVNTNGSTSGSTTLSGAAQSVSANTLVVVMFDIAAAGGGMPLVTGVTDSASSTYAKRGTTTTWTCASGASCSHEVWSTYWTGGSGALTPKVTLAAGASSSYSLQSGGFTGLGSGTTPYDANGAQPAVTTNSTSANSQPTATFTTNTAHDLLLTFCEGALAASQANCYAAASGWTQVRQGTWGGSGYWAWFYKSVTAKQTATAYNIGGGVQAYWLGTGDALAGQDCLAAGGASAAVPPW